MLNVGFTFFIQRTFLSQSTGSQVQLIAQWPAKNSRFWLLRMTVKLAYCQLKLGLVFRQIYALTEPPLVIKMNCKVSAASVIFKLVPRPSSQTGYCVRTGCIPVHIG